MGAHAFTAALLRGSSRGYAGLAATRMVEEAPALAEAAGFEAWREHANRQLLGLAAALEDEAPERFSAALAWSRDAYAARTEPTAGLDLALRCLEDVLRQELPAESWAVLPEYFRGARAELERGASAAEPADALPELAQRYLDALVAGDEARALELVRTELVRTELDARRTSVGDLIEAVLAPVQRELGRRWHHGTLDVAEEHFATQATRKALALALARAEPAQPGRRTAVVAAVAGDAHDLGLAFVAAAFELDGWRALCLGADTPVDDLVRFCARHRADLVALGASLDVQRARTAAAIRALREALPAVRVLVGGAAYDAQPDLWRRSGADAHAASGRDAVAKARELLGA